MEAPLETHHVPHVAEDGQTVASSTPASTLTDLVEHRTEGGRTRRAPRHLRVFVFPNGNFTNGGGKVLVVPRDTEWEHFKVACLHKLFLDSSQDASSSSSSSSSSSIEIPNGLASSASSTSKTVQVARVWLSTGAQVESVSELTSGDVLYVSIDPRQPFLPPPPSFSHLHTPLHHLSPAHGGKGAVRAGRMVGALLYDGRPHFAQLLPDSFCWAVQGDVYQQLPYSDIVGVSRARKGYGFMLHTYPLKNPVQTPRMNNDRYLKTYEFTCADEETLLAWVAAIRTALGQPYYANSPMAEGSGDVENGVDDRVSINGIKPRRILIFVNPFGGTGAAKKVWKLVRPMFLVANINVHLVETTHAGHAGEVAGSVDINKYDGIVTISGDGLFHEVVNGLLRRPDWKQAVKVPLGIIPGGSGNGLAASISCFTPLQAAYAIVKGRTRPFDAFSVLQEGQKKRFGFLDVAWGFISDVDFDSEVFRWMGKARLTVTAIEKLLSNEPYRARISFILADFNQQPCVQVHCPTCASSVYVRKVSDEIQSLVTSTSDIDEQYKPYQGFGDESDADSSEDDDEKRDDAAAMRRNKSRPSIITEGKFDDEEEAGPKLQYIGRKADEANWKVIEDTFSLFVASNVRGISTDTFLTPYAHLSDGCLDVCFMRSASRSTMTKVLLENEKGDGSHLSIPGVEYVKVKAIVIEPLSSTKGGKVGKMGVDGEILPPTAVQAEVHQGLLSLFHPYC